MVDSNALWQAIQTTFITSGSATVLATLFGVPLGAWCARQHHAFFSKLKTLVTALYGLPPVVVGVFAYSLFSKSGALGSLNLLFTVEAMIFAQTCLILPLIWGGSWTAFQDVGKRYDDTLSTLGISSQQRLTLEIRLAKTGVYHAVVIGFGRAIAEVGAVIMVGGNIAGKTRVMTTSIVLATSKGDMQLAGWLGLLLLLLSLMLVALASLVQTWQRTKPIGVNGADLPTPSVLKSPVTKMYTVQRDEQVLLDGVEIELVPGSITAVLGESGAGKTTLLRALAGLEDDDVECGPHACVYVPQHPVLLSGTVGSELMLSQRWFPELAPSALAYAKLFGLDTKLEQRAAALSGGEQQRLVLARQLGLAPSLLLLDECTANLGWSHMQAIEEELIRLKEGGACIVLATHNIAQAHRLADRIIVLHHGEALPPENPLAAELLKGKWPVAT
jgi:tungstate transport system ATP-binding protein